MVLFLHTDSYDRMTKCNNWIDNHIKLNITKHKFFEYKEGSLQTLLLICVRVI